MPSFQKCLIFLAMALSVTALTTPHAIRHIHHRRSIAARVASEPVAITNGTTPVRSLRRRTSNSSRCKKKASSTSSSTSSTHSSTPSTIPANVEPAPPTTPKDSEPTTTSVQHTTTPTSFAPLPSGSLPAYMIGTQTGDGTYYETGLGACGITNNDSQLIVAMSHLLFDTFPGYDGGNPNNNPICKRMITAHYQGKSVTLMITDRCVGCNITDIDMSPAGFDTLANPAIGRLKGVEWDWD